MSIFTYNKLKQYNMAEIMVVKFTESQIRERIAESGKMTIGDVVNYFKSRFHELQYDIKLVKSNAKEMINEAKKFNNI
jgi:hypothetical protein